ncbi:MAG: NADH-quinone oxidoreductase subunit NuoG [Magnetococcales bacterium]|nr:NADH-quinone oxidoreductase subunit NuoG [Magnetococcales bacterium]
MPTLIIDGKEINVEPGATIMEAAKLLGIPIPHFCYHPRLSISGNCRMCLVEVEKMPKPVVSCAMPVTDGMVVKTDSEMVQTARSGVLEFLLINHPLDCPVCDQGGECSLQDLAMKYGRDRSRYHETKRELKNPNLGHLIETEMNRCIHCTRCIRFSAEIAGVEEMGAVFRGDHMRVGTYVEKTLSSELSGNLAQLCPVGALNLKPFHFQARGWELKSTFGVCGHCPVGCRTRTDQMDNQVKRVMAVPCLPINISWICDKGRFAYDGLGEERLEAPMIRVGNGEGLSKTSWQNALNRAAEILKGVKPEEVAGLATDVGQGAEELFAFQDLMRNGIGTQHLDHRLRQRDFSSDDTILTRADLLMNTPLAELEQADAIILVGLDSRYEVPLLNLRVRKAIVAGAKVFAVHPRTLESNLPGLQGVVLSPGSEAGFLADVQQGIKNGSAQGEAGAIAQALKAAKKPAIILGEYAVNHPEAETLRRRTVAILNELGALGSEWNGFNRIPARSNAAALDLGVVPHRGPGYRKLDSQGYNARKILAAAAAGEIKVLFVLGGDPGLDAVDTQLAKQALEKAQVIYLGAFDTEAAQNAEVVLAGLAPGERDATLTNCEGRVQRSPRAIMGPIESKEDWRILRALSDRFAAPLGYNTIEALRKAMAEADHRYSLDTLGKDEMAPACDHSPVTTGLEPADGKRKVSGDGMVLVFEPSFYQDDNVSRRSKVMGLLAGGSRIRISPEDAQTKKIQDGQKVRLIQGEESIELEALIDGDVPSGVLFGSYGQADALVQGLSSGGEGLPSVSLVGL